jgi:hypothetical protein
MSNINPNKKNNKSYNNMTNKENKNNTTNTNNNTSNSNNNTSNSNNNTSNSNNNTSNTNNNNTSNSNNNTSNSNNNNNRSNSNNNNTSNSNNNNNRSNSNNNNTSNSNNNNTSNSNSNEENTNNNEENNNKNKKTIKLIIDINKNNGNNDDEDDINKNNDKDDINKDDMNEDDVNEDDMNEDDMNEDDMNEDDNKFISSLIFFLNPNFGLNNDNNKKNNDNIEPNNNNIEPNDDNDFFENEFNNKDYKNNRKRNQSNNSTNRSKKHKILSPKDDFISYFKESTILLPINKEIKTIKDLIELGKTYDPYDINRYVINLRALNKCVNPLEELDAMIGMKNIKDMIIDLIFFRLQNINDDSDDMWHLVIQGSPGCGKTEVAKILAKIYYGLGIVKNEKITFAKRSDLIGKYLGHTAKMTQEVFDKSRGGVLFIDEAYSLGNPEGRDSFSKECIDTINQNLTDNRDTIVFIAGYKEQLNDSFFSYNPGLNRRFKLRLTVDKYNASDLREIFLKKIRENKWSILDDNIEKEISKSFFEKNIDMFKYNGGDMENLWHLTKIVHARRIFGKSNDLVKKITLIDLEKGFSLYCENEEVKNRKDDISKYIYNTMYI